MFLEQGIKEGNKFSKYFIGTALILFASFFGQLPMLIAIGYEATNRGVQQPKGYEELMRFFEPNLTLFLLLISFVFALFGIYFVVRYLHRQTLLSIITSRSSLDWSRVWFSFGIWSVFVIVSTLLFLVFSPNDFVLNFKLIPFLVLVVIGSLLIPIQTTVEELVFRGYLMQGFANLCKNRWFPLIMTSSIFGLMHIGNPEVAKLGYVIMVYYIGTGLLFGIITLMDEGMELTLGFHAANNLIGALLVTTDWSAFQTNSIFKDVSETNVAIDIIMPVLVVYPLLLVIFGKKYGWTNWKEKLTGKIV
jgi:membrane protease YdiL (CAAX protease family)